jgi:hypothetical protein
LRYGDSPHNGPAVFSAAAPNSRAALAAFRSKHSIFQNHSHIFFLKIEIHAILFR